MRIPYDTMTFVWIENHWDIHLTGLCRVDGELHSFKTMDETDYNEMNDNCLCCKDGGTDDAKDCRCDVYTNVVCEVTKLTLIQKIKWLTRKWLFEVCVGKHWSYPHRYQGVHFNNKHPLLFQLYYYKFFKDARRHK